MKPINFDFNKLEYYSNVDANEIIKEYMNNYYSEYSYKIFNYNIDLYNNSYIKIETRKYDEYNNYIELYTKEIEKDIIAIIKSELEEEEKDNINYQAFEQFKKDNNIVSELCIYEFDYYNDNDNPCRYNTKITTNLEQNLYIDLPLLKTHKREILEDSICVSSELFYTFII